MAHETEKETKRILIIEELRALRQKVSELDAARTAPSDSGALAAERARLLLTLMDSIPDSIYFKDEKSRFTMVNRGKAAKSGLSDPAEVIGKTDFDLFSDRHAREAFEDEQEVMRTGEPLVNKEERETWPGGRETWVSTTKMPLYDQDGKVTGTFGISRDITERRRFAEALRQSEQKFRSLVEMTSDWIWAVDENGVYIYSSPKVKDLLGYEPEEVLGKRPYHFMPPEEAERVAALFSALVKAKKAFTGLENRNTHKDGHQVTLETSGVPVFDPDGGFRGYRGIDRDITARKQAEEELRKHRDHLEELVRARTTELERINARLAQEVKERSQAEKEIRKVKERLSGIIHSSKDAIGFFSLDGILSDVNEATCELTGYSREELLTGKKYQDLTPQEYHEYEARIIQRILDTGIPAEYEKEYMRKDGSRVPILSTTFVVKGEDGKPIGLASIVKDITERKWAERALRESERLEAISALAGGVAHNFSNILSVINGYASAIADSLIPGTLAQREAVQILEAAKHADDLTKRLVRVGKASPAANEVHLGECDLPRVVRDTVELIEPTFVEKGVRIRVRHAEKMPFVLADANQLLDVLMNLFINASEAMPAGGNITVDCMERRVLKPRSNPNAKRGTFVGLRVRDDGQGMSKEVLARIFDPFFTTKEDGTAFGLGLSVVQSMLQGMGGWIDARSKKGAGSVFRVFLPKVASKRRPKQPRPVQVSGHSILLVDDKEEMLTVMKTALEGAGHRVYVSDNAKEAVSLHKQHAAEISVSVVDVLMPGQDGKSVLKGILKHESQANVLMISGFSREHVRHSMSFGAWSFLQKPFTGDQLVEAVNGIIVSAADKRGK